MLIIAEAVLIVALQLNIFMVLGASSAYIFDRKRALSVGFSISTGFVLYHGAFWLLCYPSSLLKTPFHSLAYLWAAFLLIVLISSVIFAGSCIKKIYIRCFHGIKNNLPVFIICILFLIILFYIISTNGLLDIDSHTYIGEVTTILGTDRIGLYDPTTGEGLNRWARLRRGCAMFGAESAFWCKTLAIHPLVYCRFTRACLNASLLLIASCQLIRLTNISLSDSFLFLILSVPSVFLFNNSGYTNTRFLLLRSYEGKSYLSGTLIFITVLLCIDYMKKQSLYSFLTLLMNELATLSISASSLYVIPLLIIVLISSYIIYSRKWKLIISLLILLLPNIVFLTVKLLG